MDELKTLYLFSGCQMSKSQKIIRTSVSFGLGCLILLVAFVVFEMSLVGTIGVTVIAFSHWIARVLGILFMDNQ